MMCIIPQHSPPRHFPATATSDCVLQRILPPAMSVDVSEKKIMLDVRRPKSRVSGDGIHGTVSQCSEIGILSAVRRI
jgi:hypothetical protein